MKDNIHPTFMRSIFALMLMLACVAVSAQTEATQETEENDSIYEMVTERAEFPGGDAACFRWVAKNLKYPAKCMKKGIQGRVLVTFVINKDGSITDVEADESANPDLAKEAVRLIKAMPQWKPAKQDGRPVRSLYKFPVLFRLR